MRILLTNDDGIRAPGIEAMHRAILDSSDMLGGPLRAGGKSGEAVILTDVLVAAPLTVQSATSHGVTFHTPLMINTHEHGGFKRGIAIDGRPADCVKLAVSTLWPDAFGHGTHPDLLISGMNNGANCGINVIYSGTVAAAIEGAFLGIPSIAVSLIRGAGNTRFDIAAARARHALDAILARGLPRKHECLSINIPLTEDPAHGPPLSWDVPMPGIKVCPMNVHGLVDKYERRTSPSGDVYYWAAGQGLDFHNTDPDSDVDCLKRGFITVTPLTYDLTSRASLEPWSSRIKP
jgi:5'-nucleotidase